MPDSTYFGNTPPDTRGQEKTFINGLHNHMGNIYFLILFAFLQKWLTVAEQMRQAGRARQAAQRRHLSLEKKKKSAWEGAHIIQHRLCPSPLGTAFHSTQEQTVIWMHCTAPVSTRWPVCKATGLRKIQLELKGVKPQCVCVQWLITIHKLKTNGRAQLEYGNKSMTF